MFNIVMASLIKSMGVEDEDVVKVYKAFMDRQGMSNVSSDVGSIVRDMRLVIEETL